VKSKVINAGASIGAVIVVARLHSLAPLLESPKWLAAMEENMRARDDRVSSSIGKTKLSKPFKTA